MCFLPPAGGAGEGDVMKARLNVTRVLAVGPRPAQAFQPDPEDRHRLGLKAGESEGIREFTEHQEGATLVKRCRSFGVQEVTKACTLVVLQGFSPRPQRVQIEHVVRSRRG